MVCNCPGLEFGIPSLTGRVTQHRGREVRVTAEVKVLRSSGPWRPTCCSRCSLTKSGGLERASAGWAGTLSPTPPPILGSGTGPAAWGPIWRGVGPGRRRDESCRPPGHPVSPPPGWRSLRACSPFAASALHRPPTGGSRAAPPPWCGRGPSQAPPPA